MFRNRWLRFVLAMAFVAAVAPVGLLWHKDAEASLQNEKQGPGFSYGAKFVCGTQRLGVSGTFPTLRGRFATDINILNHHTFDTLIQKSVLLLHEGPTAIGREPDVVAVSGGEDIDLPPMNATMDDCQQIRNMLGMPTTGTTFILGYLKIESPVELTVTAVYTTRGLRLRNTLHTDVEQIEAKALP